MKRADLVAKMINEGFSPETLSKMTDKQLSIVSDRVLSESEVMISKKDPMATQKIADAKKQNKTIETYESDIKPKKKNSLPSATKGEVLEMIKKGCPSISSGSLFITKV